MSSESSVKLIENWRERWEPVTKDNWNVLAVAVTYLGTRAWYESGGSLFTEDERYLVPKPRPKTYRPWKREEVPVDEWFRDKANIGNVYRIEAMSDLGHFKIMGAWHGTLGLFNNFVLHRTTESGEWLPVEQCPKCGVEE